MLPDVPKLWHHRGIYIVGFVIFVTANAPYNEEKIGGGIMANFPYTMFICYYLLLVKTPQYDCGKMTAIEPSTSSTKILNNLVCGKTRNKKASRRLLSQCTRGTGSLPRGSECSRLIPGILRTCVIVKYDFFMSNSFTNCLENYPDFKVNQVLNHFKRIATASSK